MKRYLSIVILLLLLWNPVTLSLLSGHLWLGCAISGFVVVIGLLICNSKSLRLKVWAFNIAAILSIAYHAELLFRELSSEKDVPNLYELHGNFYFNRPFLEQKFTTDEYVSLYRTNCQGFRIDDLSNPCDSITMCDWLFIGDSFTQGAQVNYKELFSSLIYKSFPNKIILNAGISGAGLFDELAFYRSIGHKLHAKKVFLQIGVFNDFMNVTERNATLQDYLTERSSLFRYLSFNILRQEELPLGRWTEPFFVNQQDNIDNNILYKQTSDYKELDKKNFKRCIKEFKECVEKDGGELVLILIPCKEQVSEVMLNETLRVCHLNRKDIDLNAASRLCHGISVENGIKLIDLYEDFKRGDFPFFTIDEHLNGIGHELIAERLRKEFAGLSNQYEYFSTENKNERYPSLLNDSITVLYQSQDRDHYLICNKFIGENNPKTLWTGVKELIHPSISPNRDYLVFTEGHQDLHQTDVVLYSFVKRESVVLNPRGSGAAIPMFNHNGTLIVYATWKSPETAPYIAIADISTNKTIDSFTDGYECWRPIFSRDGQKIYYICRDTKDSNFAVKCYDRQSKVKSTILKTDYDIWDIALSPSGKYIAYAGKKDGNWDLFLLSLSDRTVKQLTQTIGNEWDPSFGFSDNDLWFAGVFGINNGIYHIKISL